MQHLNRSKCIEVARTTNVSLVPMDMMNSFLAVPFEIERNDFNDLERNAVTEEKCKSAIL